MYKRNGISEALKRACQSRQSGLTGKVQKQDDLAFIFDLKEVQTRANNAHLTSKKRRNKFGMWILIE
jgi:hypothetical protein